MSDVELWGESFALADEPSQFAMMEFAEAVSAGQDSDTAEGLASMLRLVKECVAEADLSRFLTSARKNRATADDLTKVIAAAFGQVTERPTSLSSDSSDGQPTIEPKSASNSDAKAFDLYPQRPDLRAVLLMERAATA